MRHWLRHWFPLQRYGEYRADVVSGLRAPLFLLVRITPAGKVQDSLTRGYVLFAQTTAATSSEWPSINGILFGQSNRQRLGRLECAIGHQ